MGNTISIKDARIDTIISIIFDEKIDRIEKELSNIKEYIDCYMTVLVSYQPEKKDLSSVYFLNDVDMPIIRSFFNAIKNYSVDAYKNASEGTNIIHIEYDICKAQEFTILFEKIQLYKRYFEFFSFFVIRLCNEKDATKRRIMFRGLILE